MMNPLISQANSLIGRSIGDYNRYCIEAHIGKGGMGEVYQAIDTRLGKVVAIKLLKTSSTHASTITELDFKRRFESECAICAALNSENIVQVSDYGITDDGYPFYVMEYLEGQTLEQVLKQESKLSVERAIDIMMQVCSGLRTAHEGVALKTSDIRADQHIKVIHRDLKPANIFLVPTTSGERVKVIDFGVAKIQSLNIESMNFTSTFLGTHHYAAPEQFDCQESTDERADIYCLGIILYEILAGVDPFGLKLPGQRVTGESWIKAHLLKSVQPLRSQIGCESLSIELEQIVMCCLEKNPDRRFCSVQALAQALEQEQNSIKCKSSFRDLPNENLENKIQPFDLIYSYIQNNEKFKNLRQISTKDFWLKKKVDASQDQTQLEEIEEFSNNSFASLSKPFNSSFVSISKIFMSPLPTPEKLPIGLLAWNTRPLWQLLLAGAGPLSGIGFLSWLVFFKPSPAPILSELKSDSSRYIEGDKVRLSWSVENAGQIEQLMVTSTKDRTANKPQSYDFRQGLPTELSRFCQLRDRRLTCTNIDTGARLPGKYTFQLQAKPKSTEQSIQQKLNIEIQPKPLPQVVNLVSKQSQLEQGKFLTLSWNLKNFSQLEQLQVKGQLKGSTPISLKTYDFKHHIPPELTKQCKPQINQTLTCSNVNLGLPAKPGDYAISLQTVVKNGQQLSSSSKPIQVLREN
jgi:serine/threonine protein kinase